MTDTPKEVWVTFDHRRQWHEEKPESEVMAYHSRQYVRKDLHTEAIEAAEQRGYARGIKKAAERVRCGPDIPDRSHLKQMDFIILAREVEALSPTSPEHEKCDTFQATAPVTVQEAARAIIAFTEGDGADGAYDLAQNSIETLYPSVSEAIDVFLRALAEQEG